MFVYHAGDPLRLARRRRQSRSDRSIAVDDRRVRRCSSNSREYRATRSYRRTGASSGRSRPTRSRPSKARATREPCERSVPYLPRAVVLRREQSASMTCSARSRSPAASRRSSADCVPRRLRNEMHGPIGDHAAERPWWVPQQTGLAVVPLVGPGRRRLARARRRTGCRSRHRANASYCGVDGARHPTRRRARALGSAAERLTGCDRQRVRPTGTPR